MWHRAALQKGRTIEYLDMDCPAVSPWLVEHNISGLTEPEESEFNPWRPTRRDWRLEAATARRVVSLQHNSMAAIKL
ncbi:hypothetical protein COLO4_08565 [Corchorus olitorius]|uniref:Uncharacterized protein n=1 Tax=Corchorus olitorius TaxID=93759 RepID=A0A1R3KFA1_9ROSI|nr:hypothetical protein COLO4_08565 [Corchorus olitorius]